MTPLQDRHLGKQAEWSIKNQLAERCEDPRLKARLQEEMRRVAEELKGLDFMLRAKKETPLTIEGWRAQAMPAGWAEEAAARKAQFADQPRTYTAEEVKPKARRKSKKGKEPSEQMEFIE